MILDNKGSPAEDIEAVDAPPAYDELELRRDVSGFRRDQKNPSGALGSPQAGPSDIRDAAIPTTPPSPRYGQSNITSQVPGGPTKNWFGLDWSRFSEKDTRKEVKQTIQSLMRDVVKQPASPAGVCVLQSCLEACQARGLSFQSIVSEKFIEGHCPLYWAIVKRPVPESDSPDDRVQLLDILLSIPLDPTTRSEAYLACLLSSDQELFQRLRHMPGDSSPSVSAAHELLLGDVPADEVRSFDKEGDHGEFRIVWKIAQFQKRMRAIGGIGTEVVARGRIWSLTFIILPRDISSSGTFMKAGAWVASVSLLSPSPATHLDAQLSISEPIPESPPPTNTSSPSASPRLPPLPSVTPDHLTPHSYPQAQTRKSSFGRWSNSSKSKTPNKPPIILRFKTDVIQLEPLLLRPKKQDLRDHVLNHSGLKTLIVPLNTHTNGDSLQFDGCTYLNPDGSLNVIFDGRLAKPGSEGDCVIC